MKIGDLVSFYPISRDRETLPCFPRAVIGHPIECHHQSGTMRLLKGDRLLIEELRADFALTSHAALKGGVQLVSLNQLKAIPAEPHTEDADL